MSAYGKLRRELEAALKSRLGEMGFIKQSKSLSDIYAKRNPEGLQGIQCTIDARYDISLYLSFCLRFNVVSEVRRRVHEETLRQLPEFFRPDPKTEAYEWANSYDFACSCGELAGLGKLTADTIEAESELEPLLQRTLQRIQDYGIPYFKKYGELDEIVRVITTDSEEWKYLGASPSFFAVPAAATLFAVRGRDSMLEYVKRRSADPNLVEFEREKLEMLVDLSKEERSRR
jgi:hypothetical protein